MKFNWLVPSAIIIAAGLLSYGITRVATDRTPALSIDRLQDVSFLTHELSLTAAQVKEVTRLHATLATKLNDCCMNHCRARARLGQALTSGPHESDQIDSIVAEMCRAYEASERSTLEQIRQVRQILDTEQRKRFDTMISQCMCRNCGMHADSPAGH